MFRSVVIVAAFLCGYVLSIYPIWRTIERLWMKDVATDPPVYFPVLVRDGHGAYQVAQFGDLGSKQTAVTQLNPHEIDTINRQLTRSISGGGKVYPFLRLEASGASYADVSLEVPTLHDARTVGWYRIEEGRIIPRRLMTYGPDLTFLVVPLAAAIGATAAYLARNAMRALHA